MKKALILSSTIMMFFLQAACRQKELSKQNTPAEELKPALESITADDLLRHIKVLASDEFEGRAPGTRGEELTIQYLTGQFEKLGLKPGNPGGTYIQEVPLVGFKGDSTAYFTVKRKRLSLNFPSDYVAVSRQMKSEIRVADSDMVFVGYGIVAPEYGWDDYKGVDVRGKTLVMLINDPPIPDPSDPSKLDDGMFRGKAMTYYGRWTYKYEIASEKGAAAAVIVHEAGPAGYPYEVVADSWGRENFDVKVAGGAANRVSIESWISQETAKKLFSLAGRNYDEMKKAALSKDFRPIPLGARADFVVKNKIREIQSNNVIAKLDGSDPNLKHQYVIYSAHWDHLGKDERLKGDQIYNGAQDNASGTAALIELAKAYTKLKTPPRRTILFLAATAEEQGLLGAKYYAENPPYPLAATAADINMDGLNPWGRTRDFVVVGLGNSTLDDITRDVAQSQGRVIKPDEEPEKGFFYRSDHFEFAKLGVPALYPDTGTDFIGKPAGYGQRKRDEYTNRDYHKVSDEVKPDWDLSGSVEDLQLLFRVGLRVAQQEQMPEWKPGTEFRAKREQMLHGR